MEAKKKFVLEFDEAPKLIYVSKTGYARKGDTLYIDGKEVKGIRSITIRSSVDCLTTHEVEYVTAAAGKGESDKDAQD